MDFELEVLEYRMEQLVSNLHKEHSLYPGIRK